MKKQAGFQLYFAQRAEAKIVAFSIASLYHQDIYLQLSLLERQLLSQRWLDCFPGNCLYCSPLLGHAQHKFLPLPATFFN